MARLSDIIEYVDAELIPDSIQDYPGSFNGLQIENSGEITRIVAAVDASLAVIEHAAAVTGTLLIVHHGLFWQGVQKIAGPFRRKIQSALDGDLALYSSHLPLDLHPVFGNNVLLAEAVGIQNLQPLPADAKSGQSHGLIGDWHGQRDHLIEIVAQVVGGPVHHCPGGSSQIHRIAVITGGAGSEVEAVARTGADAFITGEGPHWSYPLAEEVGLNVLYAGHYATETFGVRRLAALVGEKFHLKHVFVDRPTGL